MNKSLVLCLLSVVLAAASFAGGARRIDLSSYFISTNYLNCAAQRMEKPTFKGGVLGSTGGQTLDLAKPCAGNFGFTFGEGLTNLDARVAAMDAAGVDTALLGSFVQVWDLPEADAIRVARESNNDVAAAMRACPGRFEGAALLPIVAGSDTCVDEAIAELERCVSELGFRVWIASSNFGADHLYDAKFEPLLKRAEQLGVVIYLKDAYPIEEPFAARDGEDDPNAWGLALSNGQDLMVTATLMAMNGTFDRYPALRVLLPNLGEYLPFNLDRMSGMINMDSSSRSCEETLFHYAVTNRNFILTTSGGTNEIPFTCAKRVMGAGALCFGTGWPFDDMVAQSDAIASFDLTEAERDGVWSVNAQKYIFSTRIPSQPIPVADATAAVYADGIYSADGMVWSNFVAFVVYTANAGYVFSDGTMVATNLLDTTKSPAMNKEGELLPVADRPTLRLGVVAQRYPWNGTFDVGYMATYWPMDKKGAVEITVGTSVTTNDIEIVGQGTVIGSTPVELPAGTPEMRGNVTFRIAE